MEEGDDVNLYIVKPSNSEDVISSKYLTRCYQKSKENDLNPTWLQQSECQKMKPIKRDVFVLEAFEGPGFDYLSKFKCIIIGPRCLLTCLTDGIPLPSCASPMFTSAMRTLVVTASGFGAEKKNQIKKMVGLMGGVYTSNLCMATTHLIVSHVKSAKYEKAVERGIRIMTVDWAQAVWDASLKGNVHGEDQQFECYKCPTFLGLSVCSSRLPFREAKKVENLVNENGGKYTSSLCVQVGLLVVRKPIGDKFKFARQWSIPCVSDQWIFDCVLKGQALPTKPYEILGTGASTPTREEKFVDFSDMSVMSNIPADNRTQVNETIMNDTFTSSLSFQVQKGCTSPVMMQNTRTQTPVKNNAPSPTPSELKHLLDKMDLTKIKAAGSFLDGCGVYLSGWDMKQEEKLRRILKGSGATRFLELSDSVTHVLAGDLNPTLFRWLKNGGLRCHVVNIKWLIEKVAQRHPAAEELYTCFTSVPQMTVEPPSPLSKKGLALLNNNAVIHEPLPVQPNADRQEDEAKNALLKAYQDADNNVCGSDANSVYQNPPNGGLSDSVAMPPPAIPVSKEVTNSTASVNLTCTTDQSKSSQLEEVMVFQDLSFIIVGDSDEFSEKIKTEFIQAYGGEVVPKSFMGIPDYAIVPLQGAALRHTTNKIVTAFWLEDCIQQQQLVPVKYYHQPVVTQTEKKPLRGLVLGISGYPGQERSFLSQLATLLGADVQDVFAKKNKEGVKASTHLICAASDNGSKYRAAMKWGLPAIFHSWILACASTSSHVPEQPHLVNSNQDISAAETALPSLPSEMKDIAIAPETPVRPENPQVAYGLDSPLLLHDPVKIQELINRPRPPKPYEVKTPESPLGCSDNPSKEESKQWQRWLDSLPEKQPTPVTRKRRDSTPLAEIKKRIWRAAGVGTPVLDCKNADEDKACNGAETEIQCNDTPKAFTKSPDGKSSDSSKLKPRQLFDDPKQISTQSPIEGQISKLNKFLQTEMGRERPASTIISLNMGRIINCNEHRGSPGKASLPHKEVFGVEASQPYEIRWEDPVDVCRVKEVSLEMNPGTVERRLPEQNSTGRSEEPPVTKQYVFMLSNVENRDDCALIVKKLNGVACESPNYNPDATHLVLDKPARSEKLLAAISSGKWILHSSYLEQSLKKSMFLPEEDFEWGNPKNPEILAMLDPNSVEYHLAQSAYRWRIKLANNPGSGAFSGVRCVMYTSKEKTVSMTRVIQAGAGEVLPESERENATLCLIDINKTNILPKQIDQRDLEVFAKCNIPCVPLIYISDYLTQDLPPHPFEKVIPQYEMLINKCKQD